MNRSIKLIQSIKKLSESIVSNKYYLATEYNLHDQFIKSRIERIIIRLYPEGEGGNASAIAYSNDDVISVYLIPFKSTTMDAYKEANRHILEYNYIYEIDTNTTNLLNINNDKEIIDCKNYGIISRNKVNNSFIELPEKDMIEFIRSKFSYIIWMIDYNKFKEKYAGFLFNNIAYLVVEEDKVMEFCSKLKLVAGNAKKYDTGSSDNDSESIIQNIPKSILTELNNYTQLNTYPISKKSQSWLLDNFQKPYSEITLYRGVGINLSGNSPEEILEFLNLNINSLLGLNDIDEVRVNQPVIQYKPSGFTSWTTYVDIAKTFSDSDINFLLEANVPASQVLFDFNIIPKSYLQKHFRYWSENEVMVCGTVNAKIKDIWLDKDNATKLNKIINSLGYKFRKRVGFQI